MHSTRDTERWTRPYPYTLFCTSVLYFHPKGHPRGRVTSPTTPRHLCRYLPLSPLGPNLGSSQEMFDTLDTVHCPGETWSPRGSNCLRPPGVLGVPRGSGLWDSKRLRGRKIDKYTQTQRQGVNSVKCLFSRPLVLGALQTL